jgi:hypothetical protein
MQQLRLPFDFTVSDNHWRTVLIRQLEDQHGYRSTQDLASIADAIIMDAEEEENTSDQCS